MVTNYSVLSEIVAIAWKIEKTACLVADVALEKRRDTSVTPVRSTQVQAAQP